MMQAQDLKKNKEDFGIGRETTEQEQHSGHHAPDTLPFEIQDDKSMSEPTTETH